MLAHELDVPLELKTVDCEHSDRTRKHGTRWLRRIRNWDLELGFILLMSSPLPSSCFFSIGFFHSKQCLTFVGLIRDPAARLRCLVSCGASRRLQTAVDMLPWNDKRCVVFTGKLPFHAAVYFVHTNFSHFFGVLCVCSLHK